MISFPQPGGKVRIVEKLFPHFQHHGTHYVELFAGRGNVLFNLIDRLCFDSFTLNDKFHGQFFKVLRTFDPTEFPAHVEKRDFHIWETRFLRNDPMAIILEPFITFKGKGYPAGYGGSPDFSKEETKRGIPAHAKCSLVTAKGILNHYDVKTYGLDWDDCLKSYIDKDDPDTFIYCDPPYDETDGVGYDNINHERLILTLQETNCYWAISGYETSLYMALLGEPSIIIERNNEMNATPVRECLWTNY